MSGFNLDKIKQKSEVGAGLLNAASQSMATIQKSSEYIKFELIEPNKRNKMSMSAIEELASSIKLYGLDQPLVVLQKEDGSYKLLTGERRYNAISLLIQRNEYPEDHLVECKVRDLDEVDLPLSTEDKEMLAILSTNQHREKTDADRAFEIDEWSKIITTLRQNGINLLVTGFDEEGNPINENITGKRTRDLVATQVGVSTQQVAKYMHVKNQGTELLNKSLRSEKVNINAADKIASLPKETQNEILTIAQEENSEGKTLTETDINKAKMQIENKDQLLSYSIFKKDTANIIQTLTTSDCDMTESDFKKYKKHIKAIEKLMHI